MKSTVAMPVLPVGARVWLTWIGKAGHQRDFGVVAANWPCGVCFYEADQAQTASAEQIEEAGSRCDRPGMYRVRTDRGEDVLVAPLDARVLCIPVADEEAAS